MQTTAIREFFYYVSADVKTEQRAHVERNVFFSHLYTALLITSIETDFIIERRELTKTTTLFLLFFDMVRQEQ